MKILLVFKSNQQPWHQSLTQNLHLPAYEFISPNSFYETKMAKFLFSHQILHFMQWTSVKKFFDLDKTRFFYESLKTWKSYFLKVYPCRWSHDRCALSLLVSIGSRVQTAGRASKSISFLLFIASNTRQRFCFQWVFYEPSIWRHNANTFFLFDSNTKKIRLTGTKVHFVD